MGCCYTDNFQKISKSKKHKIAITAAIISQYTEIPKASCDLLETGVEIIQYKVCTTNRDMLQGMQTRLAVHTLPGLPAHTLIESNSSLKPLALEINKEQNQNLGKLTL